MNRAKWLLFSLPLVVFAVMVFFFASAIGHDPTLLPSARIDKPFPAFELPTLEDPARVVSERDLQGPLLVNVWATWCPTCIVEHPVLVELARHGIPMVGINYKDEPAAARQYLQYNGNPFRLNVLDEKGDLGLDLGVYGAPETYLIDAEGKIRHRFAGAVTAEVWREKLWPIWQSIGGFQPADGKAANAGGSS